MAQPEWQSFLTCGQAKGYPDLLTKALLRRICTPHQTPARVPTYGLFDYDADGIGILSNYKYGSAKMAHEALDLRCCSLHWIGLKSTDVVRAAVADSRSDDVLMSLSRHDRRRATLMLARKPCGEDASGVDEPEWRRELQVMLLLNVKAEMQLLEGLGAWVSRQLP